MKPSLLLRLGWGCAGLGFLILAFFVLPTLATESPWKAWRLLLVPEEQSEETVLTLLRNRGIDEVLSESLEPVTIADWTGGLQTIGLTEARRRLLPGDPRRDEYIERLEGWFHAQDAERNYRIFYIKKALPLFGKDTLALLAEELGPGCILLGSRGKISVFRGLYGLLSALGMGLILYLIRQKGRQLRIMAILPWLLLALPGAEASLALIWAGWFGFVSVDIEPLLAEYVRSGKIPRPVRGLHTLASSWPLAVPGIGAFMLSPALLPPFILAALSSVCIVVSFALAKRGQECLKAHRSFVLLPITGAGPSLHKEGVLPLFGAACCGAALGLALALSLRIGGGALGTGLSEEGLRLPVPATGSRTSFPMPDQALELAHTRANTDLPDLADWLVHRAREESLFFTPLPRDGERSSPFATVLLPQPGGIEQSVHEFSEAWARGAYRTLPPVSIETLQYEQGGLFRISRGSRPRPGARPLAALDAILYIFFLAFPFYGALSGLARRGSAGSVRKTYEIS